MNALAAAQSLREYAWLVLPPIAASPWIIRWVSDIRIRKTKENNQ